MSDETISENPLTGHPPAGLPAPQRSRRRLMLWGGALLACGAGLETVAIVVWGTERCPEVLVSVGAGVLLAGVVMLLEPRLARDVGRAAGAASADLAATTATDVATRVAEGSDTRSRRTALPRRKRRRHPGSGPHQTRRRCGRASRSATSRADIREHRRDARRCGLPVAVQRPLGEMRNRQVVPAAIRICEILPRGPSQPRECVRPTREDDHPHTVTAGGASGSA